MRIAVFTTCTNRQAAQAQVLLQTVAQFLPGADRFVVLADQRHPSVRYPQGCTVVEAHELGIPDFSGFAFRYDAMEFSAALKPYAFLHLMSRGYTHALYLDPDIELFSALPGVTDALAADASFVLTPQILAPAEQEAGPNDITAMQGGVFNLGFLGVGFTQEAHGLLAWWARWLRWQCVDDRPIGLFVDQKFIDLIPGFAANARILHDASLNVGYWNLPQRHFAPDAPDGPQVDGSPLGFFHYSGFDVDAPDRLSPAADGFADGLPAAWRGFLASYADRLRRAGHGTVPAGSYAYGRFASGVPIPAIARRMFRDDYEAWAGDPFENFEAWAHLPARDAVLGPGSAVPSLIMQWLQARHPALAGCQLRDSEGASAMVRWWLEHGSSLGLDRRFLEPQALAVGRRAVSRHASMAAPHPDRVDATLAAASGDGVLAGELVQAQRATLPLIVARWEEADLSGASEGPVNGRLLTVCAPPGQCGELLSLMRSCRNTAYRVLVPAGEAIAVSPASPGLLAEADEVWAPTRFIQASLALMTEVPVLHMPTAWQFPPVAPLAPPGHRYILAVSDAFPGSGAVMAALQAYRAAFGDSPAADRPRLVVLHPASAAWRQTMAGEFGGDDGVELVDASSPQHDPAALAAGAACLLALHRGDALGVPVVRAMAYGVPVVATDYGGCTDLLTPDTGYPVDYRPAAKPVGHGHSHGHPTPAGLVAPDPHHAAWALRDLFARPQEARRRAGNALRALGALSDPALVAAQRSARLNTLKLLGAGRQPVGAG